MNTNLPIVEYCRDAINGVSTRNVG